MVMSIVRTGLTTDVELGGADARSYNGLGPDRIRRDRETAQRTPYIVERHACIDQGAEDHVARGAGKTVEVENSQDPQSYSSRLPCAFSPAWGSPRSISADVRSQIVCELIFVQAPLPIGARVRPLCGLKREFCT